MIVRGNVHFEIHKVLKRVEPYTSHPIHLLLRDGYSLFLRKDHVELRSVPNNYIFMGVAHLRPKE